MKHLRLFESFVSELFHKVDGDERHRLVTQGGYQNLDPRDLQHLHSIYSDSSTFTIVETGSSRSFEICGVSKSKKGDYQFKLYKIIDEYFLVDVWYLPAGEIDHKRFLGHYLCDQLEGVDNLIQSLTL